MIADETRKLINQLNRRQIREILESAGFAVGDDESMVVLRDAVAVNVEDGTIDGSELEAAHGT